MAVCDRVEDLEPIGGLTGNLCKSAAAWGKMGLPVTAELDHLVGIEIYNILKLCNNWWSQLDSNPCYRREMAIKSVFHPDFIELFDHLKPFKDVKSLLMFRSFQPSMVAGYLFRNPIIALIIIQNP
jgi:hypothetical protein